MRVLLAFDKYKGSLSATAACATAADAISAVRPEIHVTQKPLSDGGEGFCEIVTEALGGEFRDYRVTYPDLSSGSARVGYVAISTLTDSLRQRLHLPKQGLLAIVEMAQAAGHHLVGNTSRDPWQYTTAGVGELLHYAAGEGATAVLMGLGGSATQDMGIGLLEAWGLTARDASGAWVSPLLPINWHRVSQWNAPDGLPQLQLRLACDVRNPLHGPFGAAAVFGPQKGMRPDDLPRMQQCMEQACRQLLRTRGMRSVDPAQPGMGAAGGLPFGISLAFQNLIVPGFELICDVLDLDQAIQNSDLVLTGEGSLDASSLSGKGPVEIARQCAKFNTPVCILPGKATPDATQSLANLHPDVTVHPLGDPNASVETNIKNEATHLREAVQHFIQHFPPSA
ncbi:MAG: glycerate kinase [Puniceicoccaceae bacterium]